MEVAETLVVAGVEVGKFLDAHLARGVSHGVEDFPRQPRLLDAPAAAGAVVLGVTEEMILQPLEAGPHIVPAPAGETQLPPVVVVGRLSAHGDHGVDRR